MRTEDGDIIYECLNGSPQSFGMLVDKYKEGVYAFVYAELGDFQDAQDVAQEIFLQAYRDLRSLKRWESFVFWLYRIARRRCIDWLRIRAKRVDREFIEDQNSMVMDNSSLDSYRDSQLSESLKEALDQLPEMQRDVLMLRYFGGMNSKEIARAIGTSPGAVRMRLTRARSQLREEMLTMMDTAFEGQRIPAGFTLRIVEAVKHIKINPMPRVAGLPLGLSAAIGIIITVLSLNPYMNITSDMAIPTGSPLPLEMKVLKAGEIPVDILKTSEISVIAIKRGNDNGGKPNDPQEALAMAPHAGNGTWTKKGNMTTRRGWLGTAAVNGKIYAIGGYAASTLPTVEEYNPLTDTWVKKTSMPTKRDALAVIAVNGKIYAMGGWLEDPAGPILATVEEYDPATDKWTKKSDMPTNRADFSISSVGGKIYVIGGYNFAQGVLATVEEYDPVTDKWTQKADMPTARAKLPEEAPAVNGKIYVIGGTKDYMPEVGLSTVEEYDPATDTWDEKADMPTARLYYALGEANGRIYAIGGEQMGRIALNTVEEYDPVADIWTKMPDMPTARFGFAVTSVSNHIYAIGGWNQNGSLASVEEFDTGRRESKAVGPTGKLSTNWGKIKAR